MNDIEQSLKNVISKLETLRCEYEKNEILSGRYSILNKKIEDGILDNMINANDRQYNNIIDNHMFKYYTNFNSDREALKNEVIKRKRDIKLNSILS